MDLDGLWIPYKGVCYKYNVETNSWMADGQPLQTNQSQTYKDENGTTYFWNEVKKLWVTGKKPTQIPTKPKI